jgi:hypothetical protein
METINEVEETSIMDRVFTLPPVLLQRSETSDDSIDGIDGGRVAFTGTCDNCGTQCTK